MSKRLFASFNVLSSSLNRLSSILFRDRCRVLEVLYTNTLEYTANMRILSPAEIQNKVVEEFIAKYGGDPDNVKRQSECDSYRWAEQLLEYLVDMRGWKHDQIISKATELENGQILIPDSNYIVRLVTDFQ